MFKFRRRKHATSKPPSPPTKSNVDVMAEDDDASPSPDDQNDTAYPPKSSSSTFITSGQEKKAVSKPLPKPRSKLKGAVDDDYEGGVSPSSSPQPTDRLYDLTFFNTWGEASIRCQTHSQDARWKGYDGGLPIHEACGGEAPLSLIRQLHEAYGDGIRTTDNCGWLPLHCACNNSSLEVIAYLVEAYGEGIRTTNNSGRLPLHHACWWSSLEVITYLHGQYPQGATKKDNAGETPADLLKSNYELSWKDKATARAVLRGGWFRWPWSKPTPPGITTTTSADVSTIITMTPSKAAAAASGGKTDHHVTPSSPSTSTRPLTTLHEVTQSRTVSQRGDDKFDEDERRKATEGSDAEILAPASAVLASPPRARTPPSQQTDGSEHDPGEQSSLEVASKPAVFTVEGDADSKRPAFQQTPSSGDEMETLGGTTGHHGTPSSLATSTQPLKTVHEVDQYSTMSQRGEDAFDEDERKKSTEASLTSPPRARKQQPSSLPTPGSEYGLKKHCEAEDYMSPGTFGNIIEHDATLFLMDQQRSAIQALTQNLVDFDDRIREGVHGPSDSLSDSPEHVRAHFQLFVAAFERIYVASEALSTDAMKGQLMDRYMMVAALDALGTNADTRSSQFAETTSIFACLALHQMQTTQDNVFRVFHDFFSGDSNMSHIVVCSQAAEQICSTWDLSDLARPDSPRVGELRGKVKRAMEELEDRLQLQKHHLQNHHLVEVEDLEPLELKVMDDLATITEAVMMLWFERRDEYVALKETNDDIRVEFMLRALGLDGSVSVSLGGTTDHYGAPSSPTTSTRPSTTVREVDHSSAVSRRGDDAFDKDDRTKVTAADMAFSTHVQEEIEVAQLTEAVVAKATGDVSGRENEAIEHVTATDEEGRSTTVAEVVAGASSGTPAEKETERGHDDVEVSSSKDRSERLVHNNAADETAFLHAAERLKAKGLYELHRPTQHDGSSVPPTATQLLSTEHSSHHCHRWEVHCLYDTLLVPSSKSETVCDLKDVGYVAVAHNDDSSTDSTAGETESSGGGESDRGGDSGGRTRTGRVRSAFRRLGIGGDKQEKKKLLVARYNYPLGGRGSATIFVRNERTDHEGKDVMKIKGIDLQTATVADLKREIKLEWHHNAPPQDLCLLRENGAELCACDSKLVDCDVVDGDMVLLRQPRVVGMLNVGKQSALREWWQKTCPGRTAPLALHVVKCEGQLVDPTCTKTFRPRLSINFLPLYTSSNDNEMQSRLDIKVCTLEFGVKQKEGDRDGMISQRRHRGFFVDKVHLALKLCGDAKPTRISSPAYRINTQTYDSRRNRRVAVTANFGERRSLDVNGSHNRETSEATAETPVHWWITGDETALAWDLSRQTWNSPALHGGHTLYDVMDPRDIRDFKAKKYSGHNKWLENTEIPEVKTTYADSIGEDDKYLTASWRLDECEDPFHDPYDENITINDRQTRATFTVKLIMGLCEIKIVPLPGTMRQRYEVVKRYREIVIDQEIQFARISTAPKTPPPSGMLVTGDAFVCLTQSPSERENQRMSLRNSILKREWDVLWNALYESDFDHGEIEKVDESGENPLHLACKGDPPIQIVRRLISFSPKLLKKTNEFGELPLHIACVNGAHLDVMIELVNRYPESISHQRHGDRKTPLDVAEGYLWTFHQEQQTDAIFMMRKECFPKLFRDGNETGLPTKAAFEKWAHIPPPGCTHANAIVLFADISGFKAVNDNEGQQAGDEAVRRYAENIGNLCQKARRRAEQNKIPSIIDLFRVGGDEFVVVGKFIGKIEDVWDKVFKDLVAMLAELNEQDWRMNPPQFYTFLRVGCAAGEVAIDSMRHLLETAEKKQKDLRMSIDPHRSGRVSLAQIREEGLPNSSELVIVSKESNGSY